MCALWYNGQISWSTAYRTGKLFVGTGEPDTQDKLTYAGKFCRLPVTVQRHGMTSTVIVWSFQKGDLGYIIQNVVEVSAIKFAESLY